MEKNMSIKSQFVVFSKLFGSNRSGETITLFGSDYWLRQADVLEDRHLTTTDTGLCFFKHRYFALVTITELKPFNTL